MSLKIGSKGDNVAALQRALGIAADGAFGPKTEAAVKAAQTARGLTATGVADDALLVLLGVATSTPAPTQPSSSTPMQKIINIALGELGQHEIPGDHKSNARISEYHKVSLGYAADDDVPWCASFVAWCIEKAGYSHAPANGMARSFSKWGEQGDGSVGDVVVFWRGSSPAGGQGHVGFIVGKEGNRLVVLGGNQGDAVSIARYPTDKVVGYRRLGSGRVSVDLAAARSHMTSSQSQA